MKKLIATIALCFAVLFSALPLAACKSNKKAEQNTLTLAEYDAFEELLLNTVTNYDYTKKSTLYLPYKESESSKTFSPYLNLYNVAWQNMAENPFEYYNMVPVSGMNKISGYELNKAYGQTITYHDNHENKDVTVKVVFKIEQPSDNKITTKMVSTQNNLEAVMQYTEFLRNVDGFEYIMNSYTKYGNSLLFTRADKLAGENSISSLETGALNIKFDASYLLEKLSGKMPFVLSDINETSLMQEFDLLQAKKRETSNAATIVHMANVVAPLINSTEFLQLLNSDYTETEIISPEDFDI